MPLVPLTCIPKYQSTHLSPRPLIIIGVLIFQISSQCILLSSHFDTDLECAIASMTFKSSIIWFFQKNTLTYLRSKIFTHPTIGLQAFIFHTAGIHMTIWAHFWFTFLIVSNLPNFAVWTKIDGLKWCYFTDHDQIGKSFFGEWDMIPRLPIVDYSVNIFEVSTM